MQHTSNDTGTIEINGHTFYSKLNYDPSRYTYNNMVARYQNKRLWSTFIQDVNMSKVVCLKKADRDIEETISSLERDEDYMPQLKLCVKDQL